jgi:hypothetical protein
VDVDAREYREGYREYNSVLRSWFIVFGIRYRRDEIRCRASEGEL